MSLRILVLDSGSNALDLCMRWQEWGHQVLWWDKPRNGEPRRAGQGIVRKVKEWGEIPRKWMDWADLIYTPDNVYYLDFLQPYHEKRYPIFGPSKAAAKLEIDRQAGQESMRKIGLKLIPGRDFHDYKAAAAYVEKEGRAFVCKPSGDADKALSYVAHDAADMLYMLARWDANPKYRAMCRKDGIILQEKVSGMEMAVGGYFGPSGWAGPWIENFENKKLMNGDLGPNTGEMGTTVRCVRKSKLAELCLVPFTKTLKALGYVGYCDCAVMVDEKDGTPWPLEWTMRDGWPIRHNITSLLLGDPAQWMRDLIDGKDTIKAQMDAVSVSLVMALPPFPYQAGMSYEVDGIPIYGWQDREHIHLSEARLEAEVPTMLNDTLVRIPGMVCTDVYPLVVTGTGQTISGARRSAYAAIKKVKIPNSAFYRTDIGVGRMVKQLPRLQQLGFAKGLIL